MPGSFGTKLEYSLDNNAWNELGCIVNIDAPKIKKNIYEKKCLGQADRWIQKAAGFIDGGQVTLTTEYNGSKYNTLLTRVGDEDPIFWRILVPKEVGQSVGAKISFKALVEELGMPFPDDGGRLVCESTLAVSGGVTFTAGS